jgi:DNA replication protein DnaC
MRRELILAGYESSGLGALMRTQSFDSFDLSYYDAQNGDREKMSRNLNILREYAEAFDLRSDNLLLMGGTGLGKTHLSTALARRVIDRGYDVYYTGAVGMFADFEKVRFGQSTEEAAEDPRRYSSCDLLIIDDLGTEVTNQFTNSCLYTVLNNRINLGRPTVISTNLSGKDLQSRYAERITSRLSGEFTPLRFVGADIRRQKLLNRH